MFCFFNDERLRSSAVLQLPDGSERATVFISDSEEKYLTTERKYPILLRVIEFHQFLN